MYISVTVQVDRFESKITDNLFLSWYHTKYLATIISNKTFLSVDKKFLMYHFITSEYDIPNECYRLEYLKIVAMDNIRWFTTNKMPLPFCSKMHFMGNAMNHD